MSDKATTTESKLVTAHARHLHIAPRKMRLVANAIKNMYVGDALAQLHHMDKKAAPMVIKAINSAVANATNNFSMSADHLFIKSITADTGQVMKRYFPRARGSAFVIRRKMSHLNVVLEEKKKGAGKSKFSFLKREKAEKPVESVDQEQATNTKPQQILGRKSDAPRTTEDQVKMNKAQNKRRLFNRKSGE